MHWIKVKNRKHHNFDRVLDNSPSGAANIDCDDALARKDSFFEYLPNWFGRIRQRDQGRPVQPTGDVAAVTIRAGNSRM